MRFAREARDPLQLLRETLPADDQLLILRVERELDWKDLARIMGDGELDDAAVVRDAARLRKRFQPVKDRLRVIRDRSASFVTPCDSASPRAARVPPRRCVRWRTMYQPRFSSLLLAALVTLAAGSAEAGPGLRVGASSGPDSLFAGLQWRQLLAAQLGPGKLLIQPGADVGLVDGPVDLFVRGTLHVAYVIPVTKDLALYPLAGPMLIWAKAGDTSDTELGLDSGIGAQFRKFALELWVGSVNSLDVQLSLSFNL